MRVHSLLVILLTAVLPRCAPCETIHQPVKVPGLRRLAHDSALIFSGAVLRVERLNPGAVSGPAVTQTTFRVQQAIRGVHRGQILDVREWGGLWQTGERYQPGEQVLLFLYPASRLGLTSPVGGRMGRLEVDRAGRVTVRSEDGSRAKVELRSFAAAVRRAARE